MERERDRLSREIEDRERSLQTRDIEDYRQELVRIRRERKEMKRQHELDSHRYEDQRRRLQEIERRKEDEEKRKMEMERKLEEERKKIEIERRHQYEEGRMRLHEIQRRKENEEKRKLELERKYEKERKKLEMERRNEYEEDERSKDDETMRRRLEESEKRSLNDIQKRRINEDNLLIERQKYEDKRWIEEEESRMMKDEDEEMVLGEAKRGKDVEEKYTDRYRYEQSQIKEGVKSIPGEATRLMTNTRMMTQAKDDSVFKKEIIENNPNEILRRQSESAIEKLRKKHETLENDLQRLNKTWTPTQDLVFTAKYRDSASEESDDNEKEWILNNDNRGYETDDEIENLGHEIEKMKLKEKLLLEELDRKRRLKKQKERESQELQRIEKHRTLQQLKDEQSRLFNDLRKHEETLDALNTSDSDLDDTYLSWRREDNSKPTRMVAREREDKEKKADGQKLNVPKLPHLTEGNFEEWKVEVEVMLDSDLYQRDALLHAVRNSLSKAGKSVRNVLQIIDPKATTEEILSKLENIYGDRRPGESHLAEFYQAKQMKNENVAEWGVRIETILLKAERKGQIMKEQKEQMLMKRFWKYMYDERLKLATRIFFEKSLSFEELLRDVRIEERELYTNSDSSDKESRKAGNSQTIGIRNTDRRNTDHKEDRYEATDRWEGKFQRGRTRYRWQDRRYRKRDSSEYSIDNHNSERNRGDMDRNWRRPWRNRENNQEGSYKDREGEQKDQTESDYRRKQTYYRNDDRNTETGKKRYETQTDYQDNSEKKRDTYKADREGNYYYERNESEHRRDRNSSKEKQKYIPDRKSESYKQNKYRGGRHQPNF